MAPSSTAASPSSSSSSPPGSRPWTTPRKADAAQQADPAHKATVPSDILTLIEDTVSSLHDALDRAGDARTNVLSLEAQAARQEETITGILGELGEQRDQVTRETFTRNGLPIWEIRFNNPAPRPRARTRVPWTTQFTTLVDYLQNDPDRFIIQGIVFALLALALYGAAPGSRAGRLGSRRWPPRRRSLSVPWPQRWFWRSSPASGFTPRPRKFSGPSVP